MFLTGLRLSEDYEREAVGGPLFNTSVQAFAGGKEKRNINWSAARGEWDIGYGVIKKFDSGEVSLSEINATFRVAQGRAHSFRFKDWTDFEIGLENGVVTTEQTIGTGDGAKTVFQVFKRYTAGGVDYDRTLTKLVSGTVRVFLDTVVQVSGFTVDHDTAEVTFSVAPAGGVVVAIECEFDVHVRFDIDKLDLQATGAGDVGSVPRIPLVELLGTGL